MTAMATTFWAYWRLVRGDRPVGWMLLMWPTLWGLLLAAEGRPDLHVLLVFAAGVWLTRAAGCAINDYADRRIDPKVERTRGRPLASGELSPKAALMTAVVLALVAFALVLTLNWATVLWSMVAAFTAVVYPYTKRFIAAPQAVLGIAFSLAIPMAYAAHGRAPDAALWLLLGANWAWVVAYDTIYAMVDREDDRWIGVRSTAIWFGRHDRLAVALLEALMLGLLWALGWVIALAWPYFVALGLVLALFAYESLALRGRERRACFSAFLRHNWAGLVLTLGWIAALRA